MSLDASMLNIFGFKYKKPEIIDDDVKLKITFHPAQTISHPRHPTYSSQSNIIVRFNNPQDMLTYNIQYIDYTVDDNNSFQYLKDNFFTEDNKETEISTTWRDVKDKIPKFLQNAQMQNYRINKINIYLNVEKKKFIIDTYEIESHNKQIESDKNVKNKAIEKYINDLIKINIKLLANINGKISLIRKVDKLYKCLKQISPKLPYTENLRNLMIINTRNLRHWCEVKYKNKQTKLDDNLSVKVTFTPSHTEHREVPRSGGNFEDITVPHEIYLTIDEPTYEIFYHIKRHEHENSDYKNKFDELYNHVFRKDIKSIEINAAIDKTETIYEQIKYKLQSLRQKWNGSEWVGTDITNELLTNVHMKDVVKSIDLLNIKIYVNEENNIEIHSFTSTDGKETPFAKDTMIFTPDINKLITIS